MKNRISSALKYLAMSATLKRLPQRQRFMDISSPEPLRQPNELPMPDTDDAWMFEKAAASAIEHRMEMLANEMDRLSGTLSVCAPSSEPFHMMHHCMPIMKLHREPLR